MDSSDAPFSQEIMFTQSSNSTTEPVQLSEMEREVCEAEVRSLKPAIYLLSQMQQSDSGVTLSEDLYSRLYYDFDEERYSREHWEEADRSDARDLCAPVSHKELEERAQSQRSGGLQGWTYDSPFDEVCVRIDDVKQSLERRFIQEANTALDQVVSDISSRAGAFEDEEDENNTTQSVTRLNAYVLLSQNACYRNYAM